MTNPIAWISNWIAGSLPAYPAEEVARTVGSLGDAVLWSGPAASASSVAATVNASAWAYMLYPLGLAIAMAAMLWFNTAAARAKKRVGWYEVGFQPGVGMLFVFAVGCVVGVTGFLRTDHLEKKAAWLQARAFVVTPTRIVRIDGDVRTDIPSSAVTSVRRLEDATEIRLSDGQLLRIETPQTEHAALRDALDRVVESAGQGSRILKDRLG